MESVFENLISFLTLYYWPAVYIVYNKTGSLCSNNTTNTLYHTVNCIHLVYFVHGALSFIRFSLQNLIKC